MRRLLPPLLLLISTSFLSAQGIDTVRVCTYNILRFDGSSTDRVDEIRMILNEIRPAVLMVQGLVNEEGYYLFLDSVARKLDMALDDRINERYYYPGRLVRESYVALFYDTTRFFAMKGSFHGDTPCESQTYRLRYGGTESEDAVYFATGNWQAGDTEADIEARKEQSRHLRELMAEALIDYYFPNERFIFGGSLNISSSYDPGYQQLVPTMIEESIEGGQEETYSLSVPTGRLVDPIHRPGLWHDNEAFADIHTQSTRYQGFGGGASGGVDDRYDQFLIAPALMDRYLVGSYTVFGNDGRHFNMAINALPNTAVSPAMVQALHDVSDHLPVHLDLLFQRITSDVPGKSDAQPLDLTIVEPAE